MDELKVGDKVFVIDWGKEYSCWFSYKDNEKIPFIKWKTKIPDYTTKDHHWEFIYEPNLTLNGTVNKKEPKKLVEKIPVYKNYKYEIIEIGYHPNAGEFFYEEKMRSKWGYLKYSIDPIYLIASTHTDKDWMKCYVQISANGLSFLTPEQYMDDQFNALKAFHHNKWTIEMRGKAQKEFPVELLKIVYDTNDNVLFGSFYTKGKVMYNYIPAEYMTTQRPFIISVTVSYDGKGNQDIPEDSQLMQFGELKKMFPDNTFAH
jgi:hypothetical protein